MNSLFVLIPLGLVLLIAAIAFFFWAVRNGQFDDLDAQGSLVLFDDARAVQVVAAPPASARGVASGEALGEKG